MSMTTSPAIARAISQKFINENPKAIILERRPRAATTAGGWKLGEPVPQEVQTMRHIPGRMYAESVRTTANGREVHPTFTLVGMIDANIERYDRYTLDGQEYEVVWIERKNMFGRTVAEVWQDAPSA